MTTLALHHICIQTKCYKESLAFYRDILGFEVVKEDPYIPKRLIKAWLKKDGLYIELQTPKCNRPFTSYDYLAEGMTHLAFFVEDAKSTLQEYQDRGFSNFKLKHKEILYRIKGGSQFKLVAPEGTEIEIRDSKVPEL